MAESAGNVLFYGDNLDVLRRYVKDETVDLVYLDPPFNSNANYSVLFGHADGTRSAAQIQAFEDTWHWDQVAAEAFQETVVAGGAVASAMAAMRALLGSSTMLAYLSMMAPRLLELRRVLKDTGSLYLHCDPTASHYLKLLLDAVFGAEHFRSEVIWQRTAAKGSQMNRLPSNHDVILVYARSAAATWHEITIPYDAGQLDEKTAGKYSHRDPDGRRYQLTSLLHPERRCPTGECKPASRWVKASRLHTLIPRDSDRWRKLYRGRAGVEREFGRLKHEWALAPLRVRDLDRVRLHADLTILAKLSCALARARAVPLAA